MKSELANKLKTILDSMSQEQFDNEWDAVTSFNFEGPSFGDAIEYFSIVNTQSGNYELNSSIATEEFGFGENNYSLAA
jgi:hypothetical protein